jgi:cytochrome c-type biogenesis protein CcmH
MTAFWIIAALLAAAALGFVLPSLLGRRHRPDAVANDAINVAIYRDQLRELEADLAAGTIGREQYDDARREIERRVLDDTSGAATVAPATSPGRATVITIAIALPLAAILLYFAVGNPGAMAPQPAGDGHALSRQQIESMVERLATRMQESPEDVKGWVMLGRTYAVLDRYAESAAAYANAVKRSPPDAQLFADYADALAMSQGRNLQGEPERLIHMALKLDPDNVKALALAGTVEFEKKNFKRAITYWERILKVAPPDSEMVDSVRNSIAEAQSLAGATTAPAPAKASAPTPAKAPAAASLSGTVRLSPALAAKAAPGDTVFIFARAAEGPRVPLAVIRKQVRDLPAAFTLDDSMAMSPTAKLSSQQSIVVGARVSKSGNPAPQPGDLEGLSPPVKTGQPGIVVVIDREVSVAK